MNLLQRAKRFLANKTSRLAFAAMPLAVLAISTVPLHAGSIGGELSTGPNCTVTPSGAGSCSSFLQSLQGGDPFLNWVAMSGSTNGSFLGGGAIFTVSGSAEGILPAGSIPVSWDFSTQSISIGDIGVQRNINVDWTVTFTLDTSNGDPTFSMSGVTPVGTEVTGSGILTNPGIGNLTGYSISLLTNAGFDYSVDIPAGTSLDLNTLNATPEPGTFALFLSGAGALLFLRRKKRG
jgi:hypothetical protein